MTVAVLTGSACGGCRSSIRAILEPDAEFAEAAAPPAPDYTQDASWAALPTRADDADVTPAGFEDRQESASVDVFFVHPTTYYSNDSWNQPLDDQRANDITDEAVMRNQASAFNAAARVYAPRYRQATLGAFTTQRRDEAEAALELAYQDVVAAFEHYIEHWNEGRPIIIASHSQGSRHAMRLLSDYFAEGKPHHDKLVAAYPIGMAIATDHFERTIPGIGPCKSAEQTGCLVSWNTVLEGGSTERFYKDSFVVYPEGTESNAGKTLVCINPVTWHQDDEPSKREDHQGAVKFERDSDEPPTPDGQYLTARCLDGVLFVTLPDRKYRFLGKDLHVSDYSLFYLDIRKNAVTRATAFVESEPL